MRMITTVLFVVLLEGAARAQPAPPPPYPVAPAPPAQAYPPPGLVPPTRYVELTAEQQKLLAEGEIPENKYIGGAIVGLFVGFGVGQAVQGRYGDTGWIFTVGEVASGAVLVTGMVRAFGDFDRCFDNSTCPRDHTAGVLLLGGVIGLAAFRIWELVDVFNGPTKHNARVRALRLRLGIPPMYSRVQPYIAPSMSGDHATTAGLTFRF